MDWSKLDFNEIGYCYKSPTEAFRLQPVWFQALAFVKMLAYYQVEEFDGADLRRLYQLLQLEKHDGKIANPYAKSLQNYLVQLANEGEIDQRGDKFCSLSIDFSDYKRSMEYGHKRGDIEKWVAYAQKKGDVCNDTIRPLLEKHK